MLRVLLVQPPHRDTFGYSMPPLGPLHLGAAARERGHRVRFLDLALEVRRGGLPSDDSLVEACAERILAEDPQVLGLGAMISSMPMALHLAAVVKARAPTLPIILGGQGPETVEERVIARHPAIDAVAVGEAEQTFVEWLDALQGRSASSHATGNGASHATDNGESTVVDGDTLLARSGACDVPGLVVRRDGVPHRTPDRAPVADLDDVPSPAWDLAESPRSYAQAAGSNESLFPIDLGRGCTFTCSFCTTPVFWGRSARQLSARRAADEFDRLAGLDGLDCAYVTHDLFTVDRERVLAICDEKLARGNTLAWECRTRLDLVDAELLTRLREAGCRRILYGVESDSRAVLGRVDKGGRSATMDTRAALRMASEAGMASILGLMCGVPGEQPEDVEANLQLAAEMAVVDGVSLSLHWFNVTPGNGEAADLGEQLAYVPGLYADLVRGYDLPPGHVHPEQLRMIEADAELFGAFRVYAPEHTTPRALSLLTRNAHLLLEVLPRTLRGLACHRGVSLRELLDETFARWRNEADAPLWVERHVLDRVRAVERMADEAAAFGDPRLAALALYERALFETRSARVVRFEVDPLPLVRAMDTGEAWPEKGPSTDRPRAVMFTRRGERVRALALSDFLADAASERDDERLLASWPNADAGHLAAARRQLAQLSDPDALAADRTPDPAHSPLASEDSAGS